MLTCWSRQSLPRVPGSMMNTWLYRHVLHSRVRPWVVLLCLLNSTLPGVDFPHEARVTKLEDLNHNVKRVRMRLVDSDGFGFKPGQFVFLKVPDNYIREWNEKHATAHQNVSRPYSFASSPRRLPLFEFIIKLAAAPRGKNVPPGLASTYVHTRLRVGDLVRISAPQGSLYLGVEKGRPIVVIAGGSGAAPFVGLLEYWIENGLDQTSRISFFFGVRSKKDLFLHDQFTHWASERKNISYFPALSHPQPPDEWKGETGYIQILLDKELAAPSAAEAYLAGPPIMLKEAVKVLKAKGVSSNRIHYDQIQVR